MAYANYNDYHSLYFGTDIPQPEALGWLTRASDMLDAFTFNRLHTAYPTEYDCKIRKAVCAMADELYKVEQQRKAVAPQIGADGSYHGSVSSITSGSQSISYGSAGSGASVYAAAAADEGAKRALVLNAACLYLANVPDANGVNLLYAGEGRYARRDNNGI